MANTSSQFPPLYILAWIFFVLGLTGFCSIFFLSLSPNHFQVLLYLCLALLLFGGGELLNHPKEKITATDLHQQDKQTPPFQRRRNSCSLGNLLGIAALLLFFIGLSALFFPH